MIYSQAQREDGTPLPVDEECPKCHGRCWFIDADDMGCQKFCPSCTGGRRPCSWSLILVGDQIDPHLLVERITVEGVRRGEVLVNWGNETSRDDEWIDIAELTLICTEEIPEHRAGHPSWGWSL